MMFVFMGSGRGGLANELPPPVTPLLFAAWVICLLVGLISPFIVPCKLNPLWCRTELLLTFPLYGGARGQVGEISIKDEGSEGTFRPLQCFLKKKVPLGAPQRTN